MVQNLLATIVIVTSTTNTNLFDIGIAEAREIAMGFRELASRDPNGNLLGNELPNIVLKDEDAPDNPNEYVFSSSDMLIGIQKNNGRIFWFDSSRTPTRVDIPDWQTSLEMNQSALLTRARYYWQRAGYTDTITIREMEKWHADAVTPNMFRIFSTRFIDNIRQHPMYDVEIALEYATGRLYSLCPPMTPLPPATQTPGISASTALSIMVDYLAEKMGQTYFYEVIPTCLVSWAPRVDDLAPKLNELTAGDVANGNNNQGVLTYWAELAAPMESDDSVPLVRYWVNVDAITGRVFGGARNGSYLGSAVKKPKGIWLNLEPGDIKIMTGKKSELVKNASLSQVATLTKPISGKSLLLLRNKVIWSLKYDSKTGLLWVRDGKVWKGAKPSANLKKVIEKLVR